MCFCDDCRATDLEPEPEKTVASIADFREKYGDSAEKFIEVVEEYIKQAPAFAGDRELANKIGIAMADLQSALRLGLDESWFTSIYTCRCRVRHT